MRIDGGDKAAFDAVTNPYRPRWLSFDRHDRASLAVGVGDQAERLDVARRTTRTARAEQRRGGHDAVKRVAGCDWITVDTWRNRKWRACANPADPKTEQHTAHDGEAELRQSLCNLAAHQQAKTSHAGLFLR